MFHLCHFLLNDMKHCFLQLSHPFHQYFLVFFRFYLPDHFLSAALQFFSYFSLHHPLGAAHQFLILLELYFLFVVGFHLGIVLVLKHFYSSLVVFYFGF